MSQWNPQRGTMYKDHDDEPASASNNASIQEALRRSGSNSGRALISAPRDVHPSHPSSNPSQGSAFKETDSANPARSSSTGPQVSYSTTNDGRDNFTDNGDGKSGEKTRFRTSNTGFGNGTRNGRGIGPARAPNTIVDYITNNLGDANGVFNGVIGDTNEKAQFRLLMMAIMVISVLALLFRSTHTPLSVAINLFVLLGSILGLVYSGKILA